MFGNVGLFLAGCDFFSRGGEARTPCCVRVLSPCSVVRVGSRDPVSDIDLVTFGRGYTGSLPLHRYGGSQGRSGWGFGVNGEGLGGDVVVLWWGLVRSRRGSLGAV